MDFISHSLKKIKPSPTMVITAKARELRAAGEKIISLSAGEPDFDTPVHVKDAAIKAINMGYTKYTNVEGIPELKQAIVNKFKNDNEIDYNMDQVIVGVGGKQILFNALFASLNPGDEGDNGGQAAQGGPRGAHSARGQADREACEAGRKEG